jgi:hypothetical protein
MFYWLDILNFIEFSFISYEIMKSRQAHFLRKILHANCGIMHLNALCYLQVGLMHT